MLTSAIEPAWIASFEAVFRQCAVQPSETALIVCETQSRTVLVDLSRHALARLGCAATVLVLPSVVETHWPVARSTGACMALADNPAALSALQNSDFVVDCTLEGLMHAPELAAVLRGNGRGGDDFRQPRVVYVSNEHPEALARLVPEATLEREVRTHIKRLRTTKAMAVRSGAGTDLVVSLAASQVGGNWGFTAKPGTLTHWPGGLVLAFPAAGCVNGQVVLAPGDVNLTFKRYIENPIVLTIEHDHITRIEGHGVDAELMRAHWAAWAESPDDHSAYAVSHVGYGLSKKARWDSMALYDKGDFNGTELRAFAGNFLFSTGANEVAGRHTRGHFDLPMRGCTVELDGVKVVEHGVLCHLMDEAPAATQQVALDQNTP